MTPAYIVQDHGESYGRQISHGQDGHAKTQVGGRIFARHILIDLGHRDGASPGTTAHNRQDISRQGFHGRDPKQDPSDDTQQSSASQ